MKTDAARAVFFASTHQHCIHRHFDFVDYSLHSLGPQHSSGIILRERDCRLVRCGGYGIGHQISVREGVSGEPAVSIERGTIPPAFAEYFLAYHRRLLGAALQSYGLRSEVGPGGRKHRVGMDSDFRPGDSDQTPGRAKLERIGGIIETRLGSQPERFQRFRPAQQFVKHGGGGGDLAVVRSELPVFIQLFRCHRDTNRLHERHHF